MEDEHEQEEQLSRGSREWDPIIYPHRHLQSSSQAFHRSLSDSQTQFNGWSMVAIRGTHFDREDGRSVVFPPNNHEGLHVSSTHFSSLSNHDHQQERLGHKSSNLIRDENGLKPPPPSPSPSPSDPMSIVGGGEMARWVGFGFELLRSKITSFATSLRYFAGFGRMNWSFNSATGVALVVLVWWLYATVRQRRRDFWVRKESRDHLILLIKEKDEKINQLLHQIAQMNQVLLALHRDSLSRSKD